MTMQIADPVLMQKIERLAEATGLSKVAALEMAVDRALRGGAAPSVRARMAALLERMDRIPDVANPVNPLQWDEAGLPR